MKLIRLWLVLLLFPAAMAAPVKFSDHLYAKVHHDRCLQCHQFNSVKANGRAFTSHRSRYLCSQCHTPALSGVAKSEWFAPDAKLDYTSLDAKSTCEFFKHNLGNDQQRIINHLLLDPRVRWAIESGKTPAGPRPKVPGGYDEWVRDVSEWVRDGMLCE